MKFLSILALAAAVSAAALPQDDWNKWQCTKETLYVTVTPQKQIEYKTVEKPVTKVETQTKEVTKVEEKPVYKTGM